MMMAVLCWLVLQTAQNKLHKCHSVIKKKRLSTEFAVQVCVLDT